MNQVYAEYRSKREKKNLQSTLKQYLKRSDVLKRYGIGNTTLYRWMESKEVSFPKPVYLSPNSPRWSELTLEIWEQERKKASL